MKYSHLFKSAHAHNIGHYEFFMVPTCCLLKTVHCTCCNIHITCEMLLHVGKKIEKMDEKTLVKKNVPEKNEKKKKLGKKKIG